MFPLFVFLIYMSLLQLYFLSFCVSVFRTRKSLILSVFFDIRIDLFLDTLLVINYILSP